MEQAERRRTRLAQLLDLAQNYKSWTRKELARALGRDPTKLIPGSGVPKLDLVVDLAGVLDWSIDDVVAYLWGRHEETTDDAETPRDFETIDQAARAAHASGEYHRMVELAQDAFAIATTAEERARACNREFGGWDGLGRHSNALKAAQRGLLQTPVSAEFRRMIQANLANAYYSLWSLVESRSVATDLLTWFEQNPAESVRDRKTEAFAHYVAGHTARRLLGTEPDRAAELAEEAGRELVIARDRFRAMAVDMGYDGFGGIANTCQGGLIEVEVAKGNLSPHDALDELNAGLDPVGDETEMPAGDWLESYGWWCIFGCNIALRYLTDERVLQQHMAVFTNKADEIAERLDNWSIRERVFTMDHSRWERAVGCTGFDIPRVVDDEDVRVITGTMARFPTFQDTGWRILRSARIVRAS
jgi:hypothetical protein